MNGSIRFIFMGLWRMVRGDFRSHRIDHPGLSSGPYIRKQGYDGALTNLYV
jgi:hypothetical protein